MKHKIRDLNKLFDKGLLINPVPAITWSGDKSFYMLSFHFQESNYYHTSITPTAWSKLSLQGKADLIHFAKEKLLRKEK